MKKRYLLQGGVTLIGAIALSRLVPRRSTLSVSATGIEDASAGFEVNKTEAQWRELLTPDQFRVLREHGTEWAGSSPLDHEFGDGRYHCAACDLPLFSSKTKFNSQTGWPSFYDPIEGAVGTTKEYTFQMERTEVHCRRCGGHLGHVFMDGPPPTGKRYCINGIALKFVPA